MGGREFRATILFVLISLLAGAAYRSWTGPAGPTFVERLRALEEASGLRDEEGDEPSALAAIAPDSVSAPERPLGRDENRRDRKSAALLGRLDPDRATVADWERLPGIGPALAARIVADRDARGAFGSPEGILRVRGIGPRTLERLRPYLRAAPVDSVSPFAN